MPTHYKLTYFNIKGRAELSRWIFAVAHQKYEDVRVEGEQWQELKPKTPFGQLPMLEVDGVTLCQSMTIARFLAKRFKLVGKTEMEETLVNMLVDCVADAWEAFVKTVFGSDEAKAAAKKAWDEGKKDGYLANFEKYLSSHNGGNGYFVGKGLTLADLAVTNMLTAIQDYDETKYAKLKAFQTRVEANPDIAKWIASRPVTQL